MRKTPREIIDGPGVTSEIRHEWLATANAQELSEFLRWIKQDSSWALHGRDYLNVFLAKENLGLQRAVKTLTIWIFILTFIMAFLALCQFYRDFIKPTNAVTNCADCPTRMSHPTYTNPQPTNTKKSDVVRPVRKN